MLGINLKHSLATVAVAAGLLASAGPASAVTHRSDAVMPNGHAGLGASAYQPNQTDLEFLALSGQAPNSEGFWLGSNDALAPACRGRPLDTTMFSQRTATPDGRAANSLNIGGAEAAGF